MDKVTIPTPLTEAEQMRRAIEAKTTRDWLDLYRDIIKESLAKQASGGSGIVHGNILEMIRDWESDWKRVAVELNAIGVAALEEVTFLNEPRKHPVTQKWAIKPEGMSVFWPGRDDKPVIFKDRSALLVFNFFHWLISFRDTLGNPEARLGSVLRANEINPGANINIGPEPQ